MRGDGDVPRLGHGRQEDGRARGRPLLRHRRTRGTTLGSVNEIFNPNLCIWLEKVLETNTFVRITSLLYRVKIWIVIIFCLSWEGLPEQRVPTRKWPREFPKI